LGFGGGGREREREGERERERERIINLPSFRYTAIFPDDTNNA